MGIAVSLPLTLYCLYVWRDQMSKLHRGVVLAVKTAASCSTRGFEEYSSGVPSVMYVVIEYQALS